MRLCLDVYLDVYIEALDWDERYDKSKARILEIVRQLGIEEYSLFNKTVELDNNRQQTRLGIRIIKH